MQQRCCRRIRGIGRAVVCSGLAMIAACSTNFTTVIPADGDPEQPAGDKLIVRFRNLMINEAVDVEFFAADGPLETLPDDLFTPDNLVLTDVGFAGTGLVPPLTEDVLILDCTDDLTIGTSGGTFIDAESGRRGGSGSPRWVQAGPLGLCGSTVTFEFSADAEQFTTTLTIGN